MDYKSLQDLYHARTVLTDFAYQSRHESHLKADAAAPYKEKIAEINQSISLQRKKIAKRRKSITIIIFSVLILFFVLGSFTFLKPLISYDTNDVVERYLQRSEENPNILPVDLMNSKNHEEIVAFVEKETAMALAGNLCWVCLFNILAIAFASTYLESLEKIHHTLKNILITLGVAAIIIPLFLAILSVRRYLACIGVAEGLFNWIFAWAVSLLYAVFAIFTKFFFMFTTSYSFILALIVPVFIICLGLFILAKQEQSCKTSNKLKDPDFVDLIKQKSDLVKRMNQAKDSTTYDIPYYYIEAVKALPAYLQNLDTVQSLIWVIENAYAYDVVGARNYLDRKRNDAAIQRQLAQIKSQADVAAYNAQKARVEAEAARRAAEAPVDVSVKIDIDIY